ncbi:hypothetical protein ACWD0G_15455, partial [Streptomyces goshikiensis]
MHIAAPQPRGLPAPQPHPPEQQHDQAVPRAAARDEHRHQLDVGRPVHLDDRLPQALNRPQPVEQAPVLARGLRRQIPAVGELVDLPQHPTRCLTSSPG